MNIKQDILNELKSISPLLLELKETEKKISIPKNYFADFADVVVFQAKHETSILSSIDKEKIEIPTGYFENFGDVVLSTIKNEEKVIALPKQPNKMLSLFKRIAVAASIIGVVFLIKQIESPTSQTVNDCPDGIACLTQEEIYNYMNSNSHEFSVHDVVQTVQTEIENNDENTTITTEKSDTDDVSKYIEISVDDLNVDDELTDIF